MQKLFGNKVKELRSESSFSQVQLSERSGIERAQISKIEQGKINVTLETIYKISQALNVPIKDLFDIEDDVKLKPFVKWAGGKAQSLSKLIEAMPESFDRYYEPFVGGGALFFAVMPKNAVINDINGELIAAYKCFKSNTSYNKLIENLIEHNNLHSEEYYYKVREMDRDASFNDLPLDLRAARMIYLNKACFNGLYRVNSKGYFNVPSGKKDKVNSFDLNNMNNIKKYFDTNDIRVLNTDFVIAVQDATINDFVYFDPPYDTFEDKATFTSYSKDDFGKDSQIRLSKLFKELDKKGVKVMLSNHNTAFINELYQGFSIQVIEAKRAINSDATKRGNVEEVIITNYWGNYEKRF